MNEKSIARVAGRRLGQLASVQGSLERFKHYGLRPSYGLANLRKIVAMQGDKVGKDARLLRSGSPDWTAPID